MPSSDPATLPPAADGDAIPGDDSAARGTVIEVLLAFLRLGLTSFGGPVAHLGYFRAEFVERRRWLDDARYSDLVALCQFLPGPASSQVGMAIGCCSTVPTLPTPSALTRWLNLSAAPHSSTAQLSLM